MGTELELLDLFIDLGFLGLDFLILQDPLDRLEYEAAGRHLQGIREWLHDLFRNENGLFKLITRVLLSKGGRNLLSSLVVSDPLTEMCMRVIWLRNRDWPG